MSDPEPNNDIQFSDGTWYDLTPGQFTELLTAVPPIRAMPMDVPNAATRVLVRDLPGQDGGVEPNGPMMSQSLENPIPEGM